MSKRILVVDDQEDLCGVLRDLLIGSGYTVIEAADGAAGVAKAKSDRPDLILMDIQMPVIDGRYSGHLVAKSKQRWRDRPVGCSTG
jgi:two-component system cell cycle response regulator DivK